MENLVDRNFWSGKKVLITGHTGFKGGWLSLWLNTMGAKVTGYSLSPQPKGGFYSQVFSSSFLGEEYIRDIRDLNALKSAVASANPEIIFHLAAQPLVLESYHDPYSTFSTNIMGVINLFETVKNLKIQPVIVNVTSDKVYKNNEWVWAYRENEKLGGSDPYSASKACSEILTQCYFESFFQKNGVKIASARAGNVIGGGDISPDRLVPDFLRALEKKNSLTVRNPSATRPWQHVLEPVSGYLLLAQKLSQLDGGQFTGSWNFGPTGDAVSVQTVLNKLTQMAGSAPFVNYSRSNTDEAMSLMLDSAKARNYLGWRPKLSLDATLQLTLDWFQASKRKKNMMSHTLSEIEKYEKYV